MIKILLVEDETNLLNSLTYILEGKGYDVLGAKTGEEGVRLALDHRPELALVDIGLPGIDGFEVASRISHLRRNHGTIVVFLTGSDSENDIIRALESLADDYIVKPVRPRVLMARIQALLARTRAERREDLAPSRCGPLMIDPEAHEATLDGVALELTPTEFRVLRLLVANRGKALSRCDMISEVHGEDCHLTERSIDFQVHSLRRKLEPHTNLIETVRGVGFKLNVPRD